MGVPHPPTLLDRRRVKRIAAVRNTLPLPNMMIRTGELGRVGLRFRDKSSFGRGGKPVPDRPRHKTGFYSMLGRGGQTLQRRVANSKMKRKIPNRDTERELFWGVAFYCFELVLSGELASRAFGMRRDSPSISSRVAR